MALIPSIRDSEKVEQSTWSKRAWTLQESVLSRRRLILTERQAIYICNTGVLSETDPLPGLKDQFHGVGWLPPRWDNSRMATAMIYLEEYSRRSLSYETDALNAVVGALNTLRRDKIYHVWGVPFKVSKRLLSYPSPQGTLSEPAMALHWSHKQPAERRNGCPSWSPLGWKGEVKFEPRSSILEPHLMKMKIHTKAGPKDLSLFKPNLDALPEDISQQLELHGKTYSVSLANANGIVVPVDSSFHLMVPVSWSVSDTGSLRGIKALLVETSRENRGLSWLLILRPCEIEGKTCYERIGLAAPLESREFLFKYWFDTKLQPVQMPFMESEKLRAETRSKGPIYGPPEWQSYFKREVVTLV